MDKIIKAEYSREILNKLYEEKLNKNDLLGALSIIDRMYPSFNDKKTVFKLYAKTYYKMQIYSLSAKYWLKFLVLSNDKDKAIAYNGLGACYYKLNHLEIAGYYFQEQLKWHKGYLEYNEVASQFYTEINDNSKDYFIAYPYDKADFTKLLEQAHDLIINEEYNKAIELLKIIPKNSKYYQEGLVEQAVCKFLLNDVDGSIIDIEEATRLDGASVVTLCNAVSIYDKVKNLDKVKENLIKLENINFTTDVEDIYKVIILYTELKKYDKIEKYSKLYLQKKPYDLNVLYILAVNYFNLKNYSEAIKYFKLGYIISKDYVFKFYINYAEKCLNDAKNNQKIKKLNYVINLPNEDGEKLVDLLSAYLDSEIIDGKTANKLSDAINYCLQMNSFKLQSYATVLLFKYVEPLRSEILKDALISINLYDGIKAGILCFLVGEGYEGEISAVIGNIFKKKVIYKPHLNFENDIFSTAYALCVSKAFASTDDLKIIRDTYEVVANVLYNYLGEVEFNDARSLSAVIYEYSNVAKIISRRDFIKFFDANQREIKKIEKILSENGITIKNK